MGVTPDKVLSGRVLNEREEVAFEEAGDFYRYNGQFWINSLILPVDISEELVTQHESALTITFGNFDQNVQDLVKIMSGLMLDHHSVTVTSDGATITLSLEADGGGDIRLEYSDGLTIHDCTPADTISLTAGTDSSPAVNYIYILKSTGLLTVSTSSFPTGVEHIRIATALAQTATRVQNYGLLKFHVWSDHAFQDGSGHIAHLNRLARAQHATWENGLLCSPTVGVGVFDIGVSSGQVWQLHLHDVATYDSSVSQDLVIFNDGDLRVVADLTSELTDINGGSLSNGYYNLVLWRVVSETDGHSHVMVNLPTGGYNNASSAERDLDRTAVYTIGPHFTGTSVLLCRLIVRHQNAGGGTFTIVLNESLRGQFPSTTAGGGASGSGVTQLIELSDVDTASDAANLFLGTPDGSTGLYSGRALVEADLPETYYKEGDTVIVGTGSASAPGIGFVGDTNTGVFSNGSDRISIVAGGNSGITHQLLAGTFGITAIGTDFFTISATISWACTAPEIIFTNNTGTLAAVMVLREATNNGTSGVKRRAPLAVTEYTIQESSTVASDHDGVLHEVSGAVQTIKNSKWANAMCIVFENGKALSVASSSGFQWSGGGSAVADGFGVVIPFAYEIIAVGLSVAINSSGTATVEVYSGADADSASSSTGASASLASSERHDYTNLGSPVAGSAGDWLTAKTTAVSGTVSKGRFTIWIRPTE